MRHRFEDIAVNSTIKKKPTEADKDTYLGLEHLDSRDLAVTRFGAEVAPIGEKLIMQKGDVLFGKRRAYQKKVAIAPFDGIFSAHGMVLRPKENVVDKSFFPLFISSDYFLDAAIKISVGSLSPTINWGALKHLEFELPSLDEQRSIAEVLWAAIDTRNAYRRLILLTEQLVKSQFVEMFGDLVRNEKGLPTMPLSDCCIINPRKSDDKRLHNELELSFVPMAAVSEKGAVDLTETRTYKEVRTGFTYFAENDVLFAKITPCMENGKGAIMRGLQNGVGFGSTEFHVLRPKSKKTDPYWIYQLLAFEKFRKDAANNMTGSAGQRRVPAAYLENFTVGIPPLDLQNRFADFVRAADKSKFIAQMQQKNITGLVSLLNTSLTGRIRYVL